MSILGFGGRAASKNADLKSRQHQMPQGIASGQYGDLVHQTEELRDEKIHQDLADAFALKQSRQHEKSLEIYLRVLNQDFIKNSVLEQHVLMKQNARKNVGEIYEVIGNYKLSKHHYTQALKIKENDSWVWQKVGNLEYDHYGNLEVALKCYEAAINTRPTLQKRSATICPILVKLAEINFKLCDYTKCEELVDSIITRSSSPAIDAASKLFALKMKAFFHSLKGEDVQQQQILKMLEKLTGQEGCSYDDLAIIREFFQQIETSFAKFGSKGVPLYDKSRKEYSFIKLKGFPNLEVYDQLNQFNTVKLEYINKDENQAFDLQSMFDDFLEALSLETDQLREVGENQNQVWDKTKIDASAFLIECEQAIVSMTNESKELKFKEKLRTSEQLKQLELQQEMLEQDHVKSLVAGSAGQANKSGKGRAGRAAAANASNANDEGKNGANSTRRGLRRKMDFTEKQLSQISLKTLDSYKDYIVTEYQQSISKKQQAGQNIETSKVTEFVYSEKELIQSKQLIENKQLFKLAQSDFFASASQGQQQNDMVNEVEDSQTQADAGAMLDEEDLLSFQKLMSSIDGRRVHGVCRNVLKYSLEINSRLTNSVNAVALYKIFSFLMVAEGPFNQQWIQKSKEPWEFYCGGHSKSDMLTLSGNSLDVLVSVFELSLFNKFVLKAVKSGPIMEQRQMMFDFFNINESYLHCLIEDRAKDFKSQESQQSKVKMEIDEGEDEQSKEERIENASKLRVRLLYAMMFCAFEIKNDMMHSVNLYQQLQSFIPALKQSQVSIHQPWIYHNYFLDNFRMAEFGDFKIKQAKIFKDYDSGLLKLKQREHQLLEEQMKARNYANQNQAQRNKQAKDKAEQYQPKNLPPIEEEEYDKYANFYLDQFFLYLNASVTITTQLGSLDNSSDQVAAEKSAMANSCTQMQNEEKVKEMWSQLTYSLCRASTPLIFKATQNLFCVFTTINFLNKSFYEQFILKKLDFEKIISSIYNRLLITYNEIVNELKKSSDQYISLYQLKDFAIDKIFKLFGLQKSNAIHDTNLAEATIQRLLITLLRQITPEFLHYNIFLTQASNNAFQNMMSQTGNMGINQPSNNGSSGASQIQGQNMIIQSLGQQVNQMGALVNIFPQVLYHLEFFRSIINADSQKDNAYNLRTVTRLLIHIDKLPYQNPEKKEIFVRSYCSLVVNVFPILIKCLKIDIHREQMQNESQHSNLAAVSVSSSNGLLLFVSQAFKFFFDMKLNLSQIEENSASPERINKDIKGDLDDEEMNNDDEDDYSDDDEEDYHFRKQAHLSCLMCQLKREKQSKNWTQLISSAKTPMLRFFLNNCTLDISVLSDIISIVCFLTQDRPLKHGLMTLKDIKTIQTFNDVLIEYFMNNQTFIQENITSSPGNLLIKKFKEAQKSAIFTQNFNSQDYLITQPVNITENKAIKLVLEYLQNLIGHTVLQQAPYQISRFDQAIRIGTQSQTQYQLTQGQGILAGSSGASNNFYFAYTKKGGALGNFPVQIAKIHETILNQISFSESSNSQGAKGKNQSQSDLIGQGSFNQFKSLSNAALRNLSRMIKLNLLQFPLLCSRSALVHEVNNEASIEWIQNLRLFESIFTVSYLQSLIHFQQFITDSGSLLFISQKYTTAKKPPASDEKLENDKRMRYLHSSIYSSILALRYIVARQKTYASAELNQVALNDHVHRQFIFSDMNFFELSKMVIDQMLSIVLARLKMTKLKHSLEELSNLKDPENGNAPSDQLDPKKHFDTKVHNLKTVAYLLASIGDLIDVFAGPSNDPRINIKRNTAQNIIFEVLDQFLKKLEDQISVDFVSAQKYFLTTEKAEDCLQRISEIGDQNHFQSKKIQQRLNLNFLYSYIQAKYASQLNPKFKLSLYQSTFMSLRRSIEIAQANKNINGLLEAFKKLIKNSLQIAIKLKYQKSSIDPHVVKDYKNIIQDVVKPILQDSDLKRFIFKDLGQSLLSGLRDSDIQDEQVQQLSHFMNTGVDNEANNNMQMNTSSIEESVIMQDTNSSKVRASIIKRDARSAEDLLGGSGDNSQMREENDLNQIYKIADFVNNNLSNHTKQWFKAKYQLTCTQNLLSELHLQDWVDSSNNQAQNQPKISREKVKLLADMLKPINQTMMTYEDTWNGMIYDDRDKKNIITSMAHHELLGLTQLRIRYIKVLIDLCKEGHDYEPIKDIFKKKLQQMKLIDQSTASQANSCTNSILQGLGNDRMRSSDTYTALLSNGNMLFEQKILFDLSKDMYVEVLCDFVDSQLSKYKQVRKTVQASLEKNKRGLQTENKWQNYSLKQSKEIYESMRSQLQVTKENVPTQLKEVFDIFVEVHVKKGFLVTRKLISGQQKSMIIQAVLNCCALCGPDNFNPKGATGENQAASLLKSHVKFLDLTKLQSAEYQIEGLMICIQWYLEVLDRQSQKKNQDFHKKLKGVMEEIKASQQGGATMITGPNSGSKQMKQGNQNQAIGNCATNAMQID